jgi:hypothetical protein
MSEQQAQALPDTTSRDGGESGADIAPDRSPEASRTFKADREGHKSAKPGRKRQEAIDKASGKGTADGIDKAGAASPPAAEGATPPEWKEPGYFQRWKDQSRAAAKFLATHPELKSHWEPLQNQIEEIYKFNGRTEGELGQWRGQFGPVRDMLAPYEQHWRLSGMSVQQGLSQLLAYQDALARDPDSTLPQLAAMFKPRDAAKVIQALSQAWGADLGNIAQGQPYVDPAVQQMVTPLLSEVGQLKQYIAQQQHAQQQHQFNSLLTQVDAFENAVDDKGNRKHPLFREMFNEMVAYANAQMMQGQRPNIEQIYHTVRSYHPAAAELRAKEAEGRALAEASRTTDATRQASDASRNIAGSKATGQARSSAKTLQEAMRMADKQLGYG